MTPLRWTRTPPTEAGWYWFSWAGRGTPWGEGVAHVWRFYSNSERLFVKFPSDSYGRKIPDGFLWYGPIPRPGEEA